MAELTPFTVLDAFSRAEVLCSMGFGPDGGRDSVGAEYIHLSAASIAGFLDGMVEMAGARESVVIEWRQLPYVNDDDHTVHGWLTMREQHPQAHIAMKNKQR